MKYGTSQQAMTTGVAIGVAMTVCLVAIGAIAWLGFATMGGPAVQNKERALDMPPQGRVPIGSNPTKCFDCERQLLAAYGHQLV